MVIVLPPLIRILPQVTGAVMLLGEPLESRAANGIVFHTWLPMFVASIMAYPPVDPGVPGIEAIALAMQALSLVKCVQVPAGPVRKTAASMPPARELAA